VLFALLGSVVGAVIDIVVTQRTELSHAKQEKASQAPAECWKDPGPHVP
jgi:hypothetical protein